MPKTNKVQEPIDLGESEVSPSFSPKLKQNKKEYEPSLLDQSVAGTLDANSKKIPLSIPHGNNTLTMSNIGGYGKEPFLYG